MRLEGRERLEGGMKGKGENGGEVNRQQISTYSLRLRPDKVFSGRRGGRSPKNGHKTQIVADTNYLRYFIYTLRSPFYGVADMSYSYSSLKYIETKK